MSDHTILIADDDPVLIGTLSGVLASRGYGLVVARDAMQAVMFAVQKQPHAILLDINMPAGTGHTALKRLRASARTSSIPVLVMSGSTDQALAAMVQSAGASGFFTKPIDLDALCTKLDELIPSATTERGPSRP